MTTPETPVRPTPPPHSSQSDAQHAAENRAAQARAHGMADPRALSDDEKAERLEAQRTPSLHPQTDAQRSAAQAHRDTLFAERLIGKDPWKDVEGEPRDNGPLKSACDALDFAPLLKMENLSPKEMRLVTEARDKIQYLRRSLS